MNIVQDNRRLLAWAQKRYSTYQEWCEDVLRDNYGENLWCASDSYTKENCLFMIKYYERAIKKYSEYLHPWSYSIVSSQVALDLLYHRLHVINSEEDYESVKEKESRVVIDSELSVNHKPVDHWSGP